MHRYRYYSCTGKLPALFSHREQKCPSPACCTGRRIGRIEPDPCLGSYDAGVLRSAKLKHAVQHVGGNRYLGALAPVGLRT